MNCYFDVCCLISWTENKQKKLELYKVASNYEEMVSEVELSLNWR